jgi:hypothetical protein
MSNKQIAFINALAAITTVSPVSRQELLAAANSIGQKFPPAWIVKDTARQAGRGKFHVPEIQGKTRSTPVTAPAVAAPVAAAPVVATSTVTLTGSKGAAAAILGMTGGDRATLVPTASPTYVPWGNYTDIEKIIKTKLFAPIFITGMSGNGKTTMVEQICAKLGRECYRVNITEMTDEDDLLGGFRLIDGNTVWQDGPVVNAMINGGILLLDEVDLGTEKIMCLQSVLEGKGVYLKKVNRWITPAAGFTVVATANTKGKGSDDGRFVGTRVMNEAFLDRFDYTFEQEYAPRTTEKKIITKAMQKFGAVDDVFADALTKWAEAGRTTFREGGIDEIISTRRLINICKAFAVFGDKQKAVKMCLTRFDETTQKAFLDSFNKFIVMPVAPAEPAASVSATGNDPNACPFN